jgi:Rieske 2Fe-2S family protein
VIDTSGFAALDREITRGLAGLEVGGTGATLKSMGVVAPWAMDDGRRDALEAIRAMDDGEYQDFLALGDDPPDEPPGREGLAFGDESPRPFTLAQQRLLELRHGVYFPWRWCHHFIADGGWDDKHSGEGKGFSDDTRARFPQTCAFIRSLPFTEVGRAVLFGLGPHDHAPLHRDTEPGEALAVAQSILFAPRPGKRFYLQNAPDAAPLVVARPVYWFNDMDYHGVLADPFFRYSIRVDGVFDRGFLRDLAHRARSA